MRVCDYIAAWIASTSPRVYAVCGAGAMHLNDATCHHPGIEVMAMHHEQACAFAAEADARVTGKPAVVMVTAGPSGTNAITGIACAYVDSIPMIVIAGQVTKSTLKPRDMRQLGLNELDGTTIVSSITKFARTVTDPLSVPVMLAAAYYEAMAPRCGPVWIEIPLDVQAADIPCQPIVALEPPYYPEADHDLIDRAIAMIGESERPLLILGNGARGVKYQRFLRLGMPIVSSWNGSDLVPTEHPLYVGRMGIFGDRAANYAVQNADLILALGTRLSVAQIGHHPHLFAPNARKLVVDVDEEEARKFNPDLAIVCDADNFCAAIPLPLCHVQWMTKLRDLKLTQPTMRPEYRTEPLGVNAYYFIEEMQKHLKDDAIIVTDVGAAFIATMQTLKLNGTQRLFHSSGVSPMGYGLSAAIGAYRAGEGRQTICLSGDGGMTVNLQELQTIAHHRLPIIIFVFANNGYLTIAHMQDNHFGRHSICSPESGLSCPDFEEIGKAFGLPVFSMFEHSDVKDWMGYVMGRPHPIVCVVHITKTQALLPRVQSKLKDGLFVPVALDEMYPPLAVEQNA